MRSPAPGQNSMCDFSGLIVGNYKGFTWQTSQGKASLSTPDLVDKQQTAVSEGSRSQGLRNPWLALLVFISGFLVQTPSFRSHFIWVLSRGLPQAPLLKSPYWRKGGKGNLKTVFFTLSQNSVLLHS